MSSHQTDREQAAAWLVDWLDWLPASERDRFERELADQFAAARLAERAAIVAYIRHGYHAEGLAGRIMRGDHWPERGEVVL